MSQRKTPRSGPALNPIQKNTAPATSQPRTPEADKSMAMAAAKDNQFETLYKLANIPRPATPVRRALSAGPTSGRVAVRTPAGTNIANVRFPGSTRRPVATTPHGRAAMREVEARRAGLTPGKDRRQSGRQQRETPRDGLRALSRLLAPKSRPILPTPEKLKLVPRRSEKDDVLEDDGPMLERPQLSLPIGEYDEDEDGSMLLPPRSAGLEDENFTAQSVELPRRAVSELPPRRLSRGSFGSIRMSDQFGDLNDLSGGHGFDSSFAMGGAFEDEDIVDDNPPGENTVTLRDLGFGGGRYSLVGRDSDIRGELIGDETDNDFVFTVPAKDVQEGLEISHDGKLEQRKSTPPLPSPQILDSIMSDVASENWEEIEDQAADVLFNNIERSPRLGAFVDPDHADNSNATTRNEEVDASRTITAKLVRKKNVKVSKYGIQYPSLPAGVVKKLATTYARTAGNSKAKLSKDTLDAIMQASDWFLEQASEDLGAYAKHAGRKTIDESDIVTLMKRQRQTNDSTTPFSLAQKFLPRELLQELRMVPPSKLKKGRRHEQVGEAEED